MNAHSAVGVSIHRSLRVALPILSSIVCSRTTTCIANELTAIRASARTMKWVWELPTRMTRSHTFEAFATIPYSFIVCDILCTKFVAHGDTVLVCKVQYAFGLKWNTRYTWLSPVCRCHGHIATLCSMLLAAYATHRTAESQLVCNVHVPWLVAGGYLGIEVVYWRRTIQRKMSNKIKYARS